MTGAARNGARPAAKDALARYAMVLAQVAEAIERGKQEENEELEHMLADDRTTFFAEVVPGEARKIPAAAEHQVILETRDRMRGWRMRAEELRTAASQFLLSSAQETMRRVAANYDQLADDAEARLSGKPPAENEETG